MWKRNQFTAPAALFPTWPATPAHPTQRDDTRRHAVNWFIGVTAMSAVVITALWWVAFNLRACGVRALGAVIPLSPAAGLILCGWKLIEYTGEYRDWLYKITMADEAAASNPPQRQPGDPLPGTMIRGIDGGMKRIEVELTAEELRVIKKQLLTDNAFNVRALTPLLADRASALRKELHALGILAKPQSRTAAKLTEAGRKAVMRWQ